MIALSSFSAKTSANNEGGLSVRRYRRLVVKSDCIKMLAFMREPIKWTYCRNDTPIVSCMSDLIRVNEGMTKEWCKE